MDWTQILGLTVALVLMLVGLVGSVVPGLPGTPVVFGGALIHRLVFGESGVSWLVLGVLFGLMVLSIALDLLATALGARKFGSTWRGAVGAFLGGVVGLFFALPGMILGPFIGATLFEMLGDKEFKVAAKAGAGAVVGLLLGVVGKFSICVVMILLFATNVIYRSVNSPPVAPAVSSASAASPGAATGVEASCHRNG